MNLADIKARHDHLEGQRSTQSVELLTELRSTAHRDRGWLIRELERALEQNEKLAGELDVLGSAVEELKPKKRRKAAA